MHVAGAIEDRQSGIGEGRGRDGLPVTQATIDVVVVPQDLAGGLEGVDHGGIVERDLMSDPLVVGRAVGGAEHDVFDPVGADPAGRCTIAEADAPRLGQAVVVIRCDLRGEVHHLGPGRGDLVAGIGEGRRRIPDQRLDRGAYGRGVEGAVDRAVGLPVLTEVPVDVGLGLGRRRYRPAAGDQRLDEPGLRHECDVRGVATLHPQRDLLRECLVTLIVDGGSGALLECLEGLDVRVRLGRDDRGVDGDRRPRQIAVGAEGRTVDGCGGVGSAARIGAASGQAHREDQGT